MYAFLTECVVEMADYWPSFMRDWDEVSLGRVRDGSRAGQIGLQYLTRAGSQSGYSIRFTSCPFMEFFLTNLRVWFI